MTDNSTSPPRRKVPPPWALVGAGVAFFAVAGFRYGADTARSWELSAVAGVAMIIIGLVLAAKRRSFR